MQRGSTSATRKKHCGSAHADLEHSGALTPGVATQVNKVLEESILQGFSHFGNKNVVDSLLYILELEHSVNIHELVFALPLFRTGINEMFGSGGGYILEERICDELARRLGIERGGRDLEELVLLLIEENSRKV